jgi:hypothetical protein
MIAEFEYDFSGTPSGTLVSWTNSANDRDELDVYSAGTGLYTTRRFHSVVANFETPSINYPGQSGAIPGKGRRRVGVSTAAGRVNYMQYDDVVGNAGSVSVDSPKTPSRFSFGRRARFNDQVISSDVTLHKVKIINGALSQDQLDAAMKFSIDAQPIHFLGDSGLNLNTLPEEVMLLIAAAGKYIPVSVDGVGGTSLTEQAARHALYSKWYDSTTVIVDLGVNGTGDEAVAALAAIVGRLTHSRWLYVEPSYEEGVPLGSGARTTRDSILTQIEAYCGAGHYLHTKAGIQAGNDGSAGDLTDLANDIWPRSLRADTIHLNAAGQVIYGGLIHARLVSEGWA